MVEGLGGQGGARELGFEGGAASGVGEGEGGEERGMPFYEGHGISLLRVLMDRGTEYCGNREYHEYELYLALENVDHSKTRAKSPQSNGICERFHKTVLDEFYRVAFRKKVYNSLEELQRDLDLWLKEYNEERPLSGLPD